MKDNEESAAPNAMQDVDCDADCDADCDCDSGRGFAELVLLSLLSIQVCPQDKSAKTDKISPGVE